MKTNYDKSAYEKYTSAKIYNSYSKPIIKGGYSNSAIGGSGYSCFRATGTTIHKKQVEIIRGKSLAYTLNEEGKKDEDFSGILIGYGSKEFYYFSGKPVKKEEFKNAIIGYRFNQNKNNE